MTISNVSFIIISRDEAYAHTKCLNAIQALNLHNCQVICIDSGSRDNTLEIMTEYVKMIKNISIFTIKGQSNAAVARNIGIKYANKELFFFLDGDVEVNSTFIETAISEIQNQKYDAVTGRLEEFQYSQGFGSILHKITDRYNVRKRGPKYFSGGIFLCTRTAVNKIGLFDETLTRSQDIDYTLRLTTYFKMLEIPISIGIHHTVPYENKGRIFESIKDQHATFLGRCYLKNITNIKGTLNLLQRYSGNSLGLLFYLLLFMSFFTSKIMTMSTLFIPIVDIFLGLYQKKIISYRIVSHYINPLLILKGFVFFNKKEPRYTITKVTTNIDR